MAPAPLKRTDLVYPDLSFKIVGALFNVYNSLGYGLYEKTYQRAVAEELSRIGLNFQEQLYVPVIFNNTNVGKNFLDFLIEDKIVLELKRGDKYSQRHIDQVYNYLVSKNLSLGILAYFTSKNLHYKRVLNIDSYIGKD